MSRKLRIVDYVGNLGGGIKYARMLIGCLDETDVRLQSSGAVLDRYREALAGLPVSFVERRPFSKLWEWASRTKGLRRLADLLGGGNTSWTIVAPASPGTDGDVVLLPWLHRHDVSRISGRKIGIFHDAIFFVMPELIGERSSRDERRNLMTWKSCEVVVVTSQYTRRRLMALMEPDASVDIRVVPVADYDGQVLGEAATRVGGGYFIMPANSSPHKNHELLFRAFAQSACRDSWRIVLTGENIDRDERLRHLARQLGIEDRIDFRGYVGTAELKELILGAEALVMPTKAEGGGSFPVCEAVVMGVPVLASDIDVITEQAQRMNARISQFSPTDVSGFIDAMNHLFMHREDVRREAVEAVAHLNLRTWSDVAKELMAVVDDVASA